MDEAAKVYLRDPELALDQLRSVIDLPAIRSFIMSRGFSEGSWGETDENPLWQEVVLTDGHRLIMWRADDEMSTIDDRERRVLNASVRTILLSTITDHVLTTEYEVLDDGTRRLSEVRLRMYTQLVTQVQAEVGHRDRHLLRVVPLLQVRRQRRPGPDAAPAAVRPRAVALSSNSRRRSTACAP